MMEIKALFNNHPITLNESIGIYSYWNIYTFLYKTMIMIITTLKFFGKRTKSETFNISPDSGELNYNLSNNSNIDLTVKWEHLSVCKRQFMYLRDKSEN